MNRAPRRAALVVGVLTSSLLVAAPATAAPRPAVGGYLQVQSAPITVGAFGQEGGTATCPQGSKVVGGGARVASSDVNVNLQATFPQAARVWFAGVNNQTASTTTFRVTAVCATNLIGYTFVHTAANGAPHQQSPFSVDCPSGTVPLSGGGVAALRPDTTLNTTEPTAQGWRIDVNNGSSSAQTAYVYAVCALEPNGYVQVTGSGTDISPGVEGDETVACPVGSKVFGGGGHSSSGSVRVAMNSTFPRSSKSWRTYENNGDTRSSLITTHAVCAKTGT